MNNNKLYFIKYINGVECRIYNELEVTPVQAFYSELEIYFNKCINEGYNIYILNNKPIHDVKFTNDEIKYITMRFHKEEPANYYFSENLKYIKENQYADFKWLLCDNKLDFLICIPNLDENNKYYYNFIIGLKDNTKINDIINYKFNLVKLDYLQYLNQIFFNMSFLENIFKIKNIENDETITTIFRDCNFTSYEACLWIGANGKKFPIQEYIKMSLIRISFHFYYDNSLKKMCAYTDFLELTGGAAVYNTEDGLKSESIPYPVSFLDLIDHNDEFLCFMSWEIEKFHWTLIDHERTHLIFLIEQIKQIDWNESNQQLLDWKKNTIEEFKIRLKEYRKLLKEYKKN